MSRHGPAAFGDQDSAGARTTWNRPRFAQACFRSSQRFIRHPDLGQLTGANSRASCIAWRRFVLTQSPGLRGSHRRRHDNAAMAHRGQLPVKPMARRIGFVAEVQPCVPLLDPGHQTSPPRPASATAMAWHGATLVASTTNENLAIFPTARPPALRIGSSHASNPRSLAQSVERANSVGDGHTVLRTAWLNSLQVCSGKALLRGRLVLCNG